MARRSERNVVERLPIGIGMTLSFIAVASPLACGWLVRRGKPVRRALSGANIGSPPFASVRCFVNPPETWWSAGPFALPALGETRGATVKKP